MRVLFILILTSIYSSLTFAQTEKGMWLASGNLFFNQSDFTFQNQLTESVYVSPQIRLGHFSKDWLCFGGDLSYSYSNSISDNSSIIQVNNNHQIRCTPFIRSYITTGKFALFGELSSTLNWRSYPTNIISIPEVRNFSTYFQARLAGDLFITPNLAVEAGATILLYENTNVLSLNSPNRLELGIIFRQFLRPHTSNILLERELGDAYLKQYNFYFSGSMGQSYSFEGTNSGYFNAAIDYFIRDRWQLALGIGLNNALYFNPDVGKYVAVNGNIGIRHFIPINENHFYIAPALNYRSSIGRFSEFDVANTFQGNGELALHKFKNSQWHFATGLRYNYLLNADDFTRYLTSQRVHVFLSAEYFILPEWAAFAEYQVRLWGNEKAAASYSYSNTFQSFQFGFRRFIFW